MSLDTPSGRPQGEHLDDEAASAALDDDAGAAELAHLRTCAICRSSVERLRAAQAAVAVPVAIDAGARESAIAAALAAFDPGARGPAGTGDDPVRHLAGRSSRARRLASVPWVGVAAALLLVALAVPLLRTAAGGGDTDASGGDSAAGGVSPEESRESATSPEAAVPVDVGDLGPVERGADLRPVVDAALGPPEEAGPAPDVRSEQEADAGEAAEGGGEAGGGAEGAEEPEGTGEPESADRTTTPPDVGRSTESGRPPPAGAGASMEAGAACERSVRGALPEAGALLLVGTATVEGEPALVYGFDAPGDRPAILIALVLREDCGLATFQSYVRG